MMSKIDFLLISDGPSDKVLLPIVKWVLRRCFGEIPINGEWVDPCHFPRPLRSLQDRIQFALDYYNRADILFIHRDSEAQEPALRFKQVASTIDECRRKGHFEIPYICIVPIRMTEAWLLFNETALRKAAGNPNGEEPLSIPSMLDIETIADPKQLLFSVLIEASGLKGRQRRHFRPQRRRYLITEYIVDFSPLEQLSGFRTFETHVGQYSRGRV